MEKRRAGQRAKALEWLTAESPPFIDEAVAARMMAALPGLSERLLRDVWRASGLPMTAMIEGVRQESLEELSRTLDALGREYEAGDARRRLAVRRVVIVARRHAEWVAANERVSSEKRDLKAEIGLWLRIWLDNPAVFSLWADLRTRTRTRTGLKIPGAQSAHAAS